MQNFLNDLVQYAPAIGIFSVIVLVPSAALVALQMWLYRDI